MCIRDRESSDPQWAEHKLESNASSYIMQDSENNCGSLDSRRLWKQALTLASSLSKPASS